MKTILRRVRPDRVAELQVRADRWEDVEAPLPEAAAVERGATALQAKDRPVVPGEAEAVVAPATVAEVFETREVRADRLEEMAEDPSPTAAGRTAAAGRRTRAATAGMAPPAVEELGRPELTEAQENLEQEAARIRMGAPAPVDPAVQEAQRRTPALRSAPRHSSAGRR